MKLIAIILGLVLERVATQALRLRELRWFDRYFDFGLDRARVADSWLSYLMIAAFVIAPLIPVALISRALLGADVPWDLPYLTFAVFVVFLCLGPRDLANEVDDYCSALDRGDEQEAGRVLVEISEAERPGTSETEVIEEAIFIQATNRIFGVIFWFIVLGPVGAWLFRVSDLFRRRAAFESARNPRGLEPATAAIDTIHGVLVWVPTRLAALGYALSGSFDDAVNSWRSYEPEAHLPFHRSNDRIVARVGKAAMTGFLEQPANSSAAARNSMRLVNRTLFIWLTVVAAMTIFGWAI